MREKKLMGIEPNTTDHLLPKTLAQPLSVPQPASDVIRPASFSILSHRLSDDAIMQRNPMAYFIARFLKR